MTDEKRNRIIAAVTVNVIILYQIVQIKVVSKTRNDIIKEIEYLNQQTQINKDTYEYYKSEAGLLDLAYKYGFIFKK